MQKRKINADVALRDIRSGMTEAELMAKYRLSAKGLQSLFNKLLLAGLIDLEELDLRMPTFMGTMFVSPMPSAPGSEDVAEGTQDVSPSPIRLTEVMKDIRSGATDSDLMENYYLSSRGVQSLLDYLVFSGIMSREEVDQRVASEDSTVDVRGLREQFRTQYSAPSTDQRHEVNWECPACGRTQQTSMDECPVCGVIVSKYREKVQRQRG